MNSSIRAGFAALAMMILISIFPNQVVAQTDTTKFYGTIKIAKQSDSTYIKAFSRFAVYREQKKVVDGSSSYAGYVHSIKSRIPLQNSNLLKVTEPLPCCDLEVFDYTNYFRNNPITQSIKMRTGEADTVVFYVSVNKKGAVRYADIATVEKLNDVMVVYTNPVKTRYKIDGSHLKTKQAFKELAEKKWAPAKIEALKKHPSKRRKKYKTSRGYSEGYITVIYSSVPFKEIQ